MEQLDIDHVRPAQIAQHQFLRIGQLMAADVA
jgi:hypothetical protein